MKAHTLQLHRKPEVRHRVEGLGNAAEVALAERAILVEEDVLLTQQNKVNDCRKGHNPELKPQESYELVGLSGRRKQIGRAVRLSRPRRVVGSRTSCRMLQDEIGDAGEVQHQSSSLHINTSSSVESL